MHLLIDIPEEQERESDTDLDGEFNSGTYRWDAPHTIGSHFLHETPEVADEGDPHEAKVSVSPVAPEAHPYVWSM